MTSYDLCGVMTSYESTTIFYTKTNPQPATITGYKSLIYDGDKPLIGSRPRNMIEGSSVTNMTR